MSTLPAIESYADQLVKLANQHGVNLKQCFAHAGVASSTYYRSITGDKSLRLPVAQKIRAAIIDQANSQ